MIAVSGIQRSRPKRPHPKMLPRLLRARPVVAAASRMAMPANRLAAMRPASAPVAMWARAFSSGFLPKEEVAERIMRVVKNFQNVDPNKVSPAAHFTNDLGLDSLDTVEVRK